MSQTNKALPLLEKDNKMGSQGIANDPASGSAEDRRMLAYAAPSLFQPHNARQAIRDAHERKIAPLMCVFYGISSVPVARLLAPFGFDAVWIDWEHSSCNVETMTTIVHETMFMSGGRTIPFVRVPGHDHASIGFALDCGASVVIPQVDTVEQCKHVISAAKYGTKQNGSRSAPPFRLIPGVTDMPMMGNDLHKSLNDQAAIMIQTETLEGINNLDAILTECPEVDMVWLGALDARVSMNLIANQGMAGTEPEWIEAEKKFEETIKKHNKPRGGFGFGPMIKTNMEKGFALITYDADVMKLGSMGKSLADARAEIAEYMKK
ncbi:putative Pyruvate/Phosphoenolpyruvate kinase-like domain-containing protein [Seiridium unicorne]|uniref:Pyruvate/Phosphoenolpyruvate kinase-like domain-containing protein n=1 Tax=Seiridium unicorne TaxID=138068 RepID=A0ABR2UWN1_9PEZI